MFEFVKLPELDFDLKAVTTENGRVYSTPSGKNYPSVTTVLSPYGKKALFEWRERVGAEEANKIAAKASRRGTALHTVCEKYLLNEMTRMKLVSMMPTTKELFFKIKPYIDENIGKVYALEQALYSDILRIAGRVDCIAEWNNKLSIIDFKSSTRQKDKDGIANYFMQCTAYAIMFQELTGRAIDQIVVLIGTENGPGQIFVESKQNYAEMLQKYIDNHYRKNS
jgi:genome maintenance exonuclease 1